MKFIVLNSDLGLLLGHLPCRLDLPDLGRSGDWLPVRTQGALGCIAAALARRIRHPLLGGNRKGGKGLRRSQYVE